MGNKPIGKNWDQNIITNCTVRASRANLMVFEKWGKKWDWQKHMAKIWIYSGLAESIRTNRPVANVKIIPIILSTAGGIPEKKIIFEKKCNGRHFWVRHELSEDLWACKELNKNLNNSKIEICSVHPLIDRSLHLRLV